MDIASLGVGAAIALTILSVVFGFLIKMRWLTTTDSPLQQTAHDDIRNKLNCIEKSTDKTERLCEENEKELKELYKQVDDLHTMHNVRDDNGVPIWYRSKALDELVTTQARALNDIALTLKKLELIQLNQSKMIDSQNKLFEKMFDKLENIKR